MLPGLERLGITTPVHLSVATAADRCQAKAVSCHMISTPLPAGSFIRAKHEVYVSSPSLCFVQMAATTPFIDLVQLGFELCGSYALSIDGRETFRKQDPLSTVDLLTLYTQKVPGLFGVKKARRALRFVMNGSASPMETILVMLLCLPPARGGYGLKPPRLNYRITMRKEAHKVSDSSFYLCDLCWPEANLAVEYDSTMFHTGAERITNDSKRRNALTFMDLTVVSVTRDQVFDSRELDKVARLLARRIGQRLYERKGDSMSKRYELRSALFATMTR